MRHIKRLGLSAVTGLAAALCCASVAAAATPSPDTSRPKPSNDKTKVFNLTTVVTAANFIDVDPTGSSQGDELVATGTVFRSGSEVGRYDEVCTVTRVESSGGFTFQCQVTLTLPDGQLTVQGVFPITESGAGEITLAITGGTGKYRTAKGYVEAVNTSDTVSEVEVHLIR
ncbi:dirigent protein [Streptomyces sp. NPDC059828]|uniref:dirigent protein n=1 Tax=Streptomyces sp. NPDC059828 TaxID=3346965 RepID=UPI00365881CF